MNWKTTIASVVTSWLAAVGTTAVNQWLGIGGFLLSLFATVFAVRSAVSTRRLNELTYSQVMVSLCRNCQESHRSPKLCPLPEDLREKFCPRLKP